MLGFATAQAKETTAASCSSPKVFGMSGDLGDTPGILKLREKYDFRLMIDDAHGFGTMGETGAGVSEHFGVMDEVDIYFTFAKSMAGIGAFVASEKAIVDSLKYNMRSNLRKIPSHADGRGRTQSGWRCSKRNPAQRTSGR